MADHFSNPNGLELSASLSENEVLRIYMEHFYGMVAGFAQLMDHPAFNRYRTLTDHNGKPWEDIGALWEINLRPIGDELSCATSELSEYDCPSLWIESRPEGVLIELFFRKGTTTRDEEYFGKPWLRDLITSEPVTHIGFCYESNLPEIGFLERLFRMGSRKLESKNAETNVQLGFDTLVLDRSFEPTPTGVLPIFANEYWRKIFTFPFGNGKRAFESETNRDRDDGNFWYRGFPTQRYSSMQLTDLFSRVNQLFDYILPPLIRETQSTNVLSDGESSRRLDRKPKRAIGHRTHS